MKVNNNNSNVYPYRKKKPNLSDIIKALSSFYKRYYEI